jgi:hypothetical protein
MTCTASNQFEIGGFNARPAQLSVALNPATPAIKKTEPDPISRMDFRVTLRKKGTELPDSSIYTINPGGLARFRNTGPFG